MPRGPRALAPPGTTYRRDRSIKVVAERFSGGHLRIGIFACPYSSLQLTSKRANLLRFQAFRGCVL